MKKIKICAIVLALLGNLLTLAAETILFKENFADCSSKNKYLKMAPVSDHSEIKQALELLSGKGPSGKFETATWVSPVFDAANAEMLTVDYFLKSTPQSHYALFVMGENGKMIVSVLVEKGKFSCNSAGPWVNVGEVKYGQWQKIRYVIYPVKKTFDVYIDDMSVPAARGLRYRFPEDTLPGKFWIKGSVTEDSQTSIANIVLRQNKSFSGLSQDLAAAPYFLLPVWEVDKPPATADWEKVQPVELGKIRAGAEEKSCFRALWDKENIYLQFEAEAKDMEPRKKGVTGKDQRIWINDCVEIFLSPGGGYPYYQLVANSIGSQYDARVDLGSIVDRSWDSGWSCRVDHKEQKWIAEIAIPMAELSQTPEAGKIWGFNVGRENPVAKEITSWTQTASFLNPKNFGKLVFMNRAFAGQPPVKLNADLQEKIFNTGEMEKSVAANLKSATAADIFKDRTKKLNNIYLDYKKSIAGINHYFKVKTAYEKLSGLVAESDKLCLDIDRMKKFFSPDSASARRTYAYCIESPLVKIQPEQYGGTSGTQAELNLAGNEYGSFQVVLLTDGSWQFSEVGIELLPLRSASGSTSEKSRIQSYQVKYITTARPRQVQSSIPDVLIPADKAKAAIPAAVLPVWFDIYIAAGTPPGEYQSEIILTPAGKTPVKIPVKVNVLPFDLPQKASLKTAFCFVGEWAETYYGKAMTEKQRRNYWQFILDHRLEPMNLWISKKQKLEMSEADLDWAAERGKTMLFLPIRGLRDNLDYYRGIVEKYQGRLNPYFFGHDEVLRSASPTALTHLREDYTYAREVMPEVARLNTAAVDEQLYGYVNVWCPLFNHFDAALAKSRLELGEQIWWYPTDKTLQPYANFNLDSPAIDPRIIPWMNWKLNISGLLYWALNREWLTQIREPKLLSATEKKDQKLEWMTSEMVEQINRGVRWPQVEWLPYFRHIANKTANPSTTSGGGNLMYPGPDFEPYASVRLKNLRDGMQDYEYLIILKQNYEKLKAVGKNPALIKKIETMLEIDPVVVTSAVSYTQSPELLENYKKKLGEMIILSNQELHGVN